MNGGNTYCFLSNHKHDPETAQVNGFLEQLLNRMSTVICICFGFAELSSVI